MKNESGNLDQQPHSGFKWNNYSWLCGPPRTHQRLLSFTAPSQHPPAARIRLPIPEHILRALLAIGRSHRRPSYPASRSAWSSLRPSSWKCQSSSRTFCGFSRQSGTTFTNVCKYTFVPNSSSSSLRASVPIFFSISPLCADQDFLLRRALHVQRRFNAQQLQHFLEFVDEHGERVRHFVIHDLDRFLANNFRRQKSFRLIGDLVFGKVRLALRQLLQDFFLQLRRRQCPSARKSERLPKTQTLC